MAKGLPIARKTMMIEIWQDDIWNIIRRHYNGGPSEYTSYYCVATINYMHYFAGAEFQQVYQAVFWPEFHWVT